MNSYYQQKIALKVTIISEIKIHLALLGIFEENLIFHPFCVTSNFRKKLMNVFVIWVCRLFKTSVFIKYCLGANE